MKHQSVRLTDATSPSTSEERAHEGHEALKVLFGGLLAGLVVGTAVSSRHRRHRQFLFFSVYNDNVETKRHSFEKQTAEMKSKGFKRMSVSSFYLQMFKLCVQYGKCKMYKEANYNEDATPAAPTAVMPKGAADAELDRYFSTGTSSTVRANSPPAAAMVMPPGDASEFMEFDNYPELALELQPAAIQKKHDLGAKLEGAAHAIKSKIESAAQHLAAEGEDAADEVGNIFVESRQEQCPLLCKQLVDHLRGSGLAEALERSGHMLLEKMFKNVHLTIIVQFEGKTAPLHFKELCSHMTTCYPPSDAFHSEVAFYGPFAMGALQIAKDRLEAKHGTLEFKTLEGKRVSAGQRIVGAAKIHVEGRRQKAEKEKAEKEKADALAAVVQDVVSKTNITVKAKK
jgi:hypothetical protein